MGNPSYVCGESDDYHNTSELRVLWRHPPMRRNFAGFVHAGPLEVDHNEQSDRKTHTVNNADPGRGSANYRDQQYQPRAEGNTEGRPNETSIYAPKQRRDPPNAAEMGQCLGSLALQPE
jgi:hypothetical protein